MNTMLVSSKVIQQMTVHEATRIACEYKKLRNENPDGLLLERSYPCLGVGDSLSR